MHKCANWTQCASLPSRLFCDEAESLLQSSVFQHWLCACVRKVSVILWLSSSSTLPPDTLNWRKPIYDQATKQVALSFLPSCASVSNSDFRSDLVSPQCILPICVPERCQSVQCCALFLLSLAFCNCFVSKPFCTVGIVYRPVEIACKRTCFTSACAHTVYYVADWTCKQAERRTTFVLNFVENNTTLVVAKLPNVRVSLFSPAVLHSRKHALIGNSYRLHISQHYCFNCSCVSQRVHYTVYSQHAACFARETLGQMLHLRSILNLCQKDLWNTSSAWLGSLNEFRLALANFSHLSI